MRKIIGLVCITIILAAFPFFANAAWVDADKSDQESAEISTDSSNRGPVELALDSKGRPHIAFKQSGDSPAKEYICYLFFNGSAWVDADGTGTESVRINEGYDFSFGLNNNDQPAFAFQRDAPGSLAYLYFNGSAWVDADGSGQGEMVLYGNNLNIEPSLRFNSNNQPGIAFANSTDGGANYELAYLYFNGSAWVDADGSGQEGIIVYNQNEIENNPSLVFRTDNDPAIAWTSQTAGIDYTNYLYFDGSAWVDADGSGQGEVSVDDTGGNPSLALTSGGNVPGIAWWSDGEIYYAYFNGSAWVGTDGKGQESIVISNNAGNSLEPSLALNSATYYPAIAWYDDTKGTNAGIFYLQWNGSAWVDIDGTGQESIEIHKTAGSSKSSSKSLALDQKTNYPRIAFWDNAGGSDNPQYLEWYVPTNPPTIDSVNLENNQEISGIYQICASVSDNSGTGIDKVIFNIDDTPVYTDYDASYCYDWDTTDYSSSHIVTIAAYDNNGGFSKAAYMVTVTGNLSETRTIILIIIGLVCLFSLIVIFFILKKAHQELINSKNKNNS